MFEVDIFYKDKMFVMYDRLTLFLNNSVIKIIFYK